jgi:phosphoenolpyruvate carboxykinase (ATP)
MPIGTTRALLSAALDGKLGDTPMRTDPHFGFAVPIAVDGVDPRILNPRETWSDKAAYDAQARKLVAMFVKNFETFEGHVGSDVRAASPSIRMAAE